jgi:hypothetical protein
MVRRVAILLSGQMRRYTDPDVLHSLHRFWSLFDHVDVFISTWSDRGVSYNHGHMKSHGDETDGVTEAELRRIYPQARRIRIHSLGEWERGLEGVWKSVYAEGFEWNGMHIRGTVVPQLFGIWDANQQRLAYQAETGAQYDLVIRCRPDTIFVPHSRSIYESAATNAIYAINNRSTATFYPQRIYDIFFFGSSKAMDAVCEAYKELPELLRCPWDNGLHPRDACRCLYVQARFQHGLEVVDLPLDVCAVKR